ncbi:hypothetical protein [Cryobacterium sp. N22]|uniref:hypothetical protein n=1 Tax=Cryobacterium sp. N22 TaxID=2048290 RepID=UPI000CE472D0|nr:hypothetical protein [Cryobacterium sp. N22]
MVATHTLIEPVEIPRAGHVREARSPGLDKLDQRDGRDPHTGPTNEMVATHRWSSLSRSREPGTFARPGRQVSTSSTNEMVATHTLIEPVEIPRAGHVREARSPGLDKLDQRDGRDPNTGPTNEMVATNR